MTLFEVGIGIGVVAFLALGTFFRYRISVTWFFGHYTSGLLQNRNRSRLT